MTDKQIIIDGGDVSGCEYYFDEKCRCMDASIMQDFYSCPQCNSNPNCYYKQLKRDEQRIVDLNKTIKSKEQECKRWEEINKYSQDKLLEQVKVVCKLKQTLTEIKEMIPPPKGAKLHLVFEKILKKISEVENV